MVRRGAKYASDRCKSSTERDKRLTEVAELAAGMRFGWQGYADRLDEWGRGFRA